MELSKPIAFDKHIRPICLFEEGMEFPWGTLCSITGWGHTKFNGSQPEALHEARVALVSDQECNKKESYDGKVHKEVSICAGFKEGGIDACNFDSGGPLACDKYGKFFLIGLTSWGFECARPHKYGVYANMMTLTKWVKKTIENN